MSLDKIKDWTIALIAISTLFACFCFFYFWVFKPEFFEKAPGNVRRAVNPSVEKTLDELEVDEEKGIEKPLKDWTFKWGSENKVLKGEKTIVLDKEKKMGWRERARHLAAVAVLMELRPDIDHPRVWIAEEDLL